jgi:hypothetical protein
MNKKMPEKVFAAIDEYVKRHREGENPTIEEYIKQFPEWREEFEDVRFTSFKPLTHHRAFSRNIPWIKSFVLFCLTLRRMFKSHYGRN